MKICAHCGGSITVIERISRGSMCPHCGKYLHSCVNCRFYSPGSYHDCGEPQAEYVSDKKAANFCDYFVFRDSDEKLSALKEDEKKTARDEFDKLFGD